MPIAAARPASFRRYLPPLLLVLAIGLTFGRLLTARFTTFDDWDTIAHNPRFDPPTWSGIGYYWAHASADIYTPLSYTVWGLLAKASWVATPDEFGISVDPRLYHGANILIHCVSACCVYGILLRLLSKPWAALAGGLLFALHPIQVEAVAWASGTKDLLAGAFSLAAILTHLSAVQSSSRSRHLLACFFFALAMLGKASAVGALPIVLVIDCVLLRRSWRKTALEIWPWLVLAVPILIVNRIAQLAPGTRAVPLLDRPLIPGVTLTFYLYKILLPIHLTVQYPLRPLEMIHHWWIYAGWLVPLLLGLVIWRLRRRGLSTAGLIFVCAPITVLGFVPVDWQWFSATADHYLYLAMLGPAMAVALGLSFVKAIGRRMVVFGTTVVMIALAIGSFRQTAFWHDTFTLSAHTLAVNPRSFIGYSMLAVETGPSDPNFAIRKIQDAVAIEPAYWNAVNVLKDLLDRQGRTAEARQLMIDSLAYNESLPPDQRFDATDSYLQLAETFESAGESARAREYYLKALAQHPNESHAIDGLHRIEKHSPRHAR